MWSKHTLHLGVSCIPHNVGHVLNASLPQTWSVECEVQGGFGSPAQGKPLGISITLKHLLEHCSYLPSIGVWYQLWLWIISFYHWFMKQAKIINPISLTLVHESDSSLPVDVHKWVGGRMDRRCMTIIGARCHLFTPLFCVFLFTQFRTSYYWVMNISRQCLQSAYHFVLVFVQTAERAKEWITICSTKILIWVQLWFLVISKCTPIFSSHRACWYVRVLCSINGNIQKKKKKCSINGLCSKMQVLAILLFW